MAGSPPLMATVLKITFEYLTFAYLRQCIIQPRLSCRRLPHVGSQRHLSLIQAIDYRGKLAIIWAAVISGPVLRRLTASFVVEFHAFYLPVGGVSGKARRHTRVVVRFGARHLCSMSGASNESTKAQTLVRELLAQGIEIKIYSCGLVNVIDLLMNHKQRQDGPTQRHFPVRNGFPGHTIRANVS